MASAINLLDDDAPQRALRRVRALSDALGEAPGARLLRRAALIARDEAVQELSQPGSGRTYTRRFWVDAQGRLRLGGPRPPHTASAPGDPPAVDTGELRASIDFEVVDGVAYVGTGLEKGRLLEYGFATAWGTLVRPRPWLSTVAARLAGSRVDGFTIAVRDYVSEVLRGQG